MRPIRPLITPVLAAALMLPTLALPALAVPVAAQTPPATIGQQYVPAPWWMRDPVIASIGYVRVELQANRAAFNAFAQRSPDHAELASMAWDKITDSRKPQEFAVEEKDRTLHAGDMDLALRDPSQHLGPITVDMRTLALYRTEMPDEEFGAAVQEEIRKSMNSAFRRGSMPSQSTWSQSAVLRKWPRFGSLSITAISSSQSLRTGVTSMASSSVKSVV